MPTEYYTTKLRSYVSYPTFQLHAQISSKELDTDSIFRLCVLETFLWLRNRYSSVKEPPAEITCVPEPDMYETFSESELHSFSCDNGGSLSVTYIPDAGLWAMQLKESDRGVNMGTDKARPPVSERTFCTEFTFRKNESGVESAFRTICTEPEDVDTSLPENKCEVFRPTVVLRLLSNEKLTLSKDGIIIGRQPLIVDSADMVQRLADAYRSKTFRTPVVIAADAGYSVAFSRAEETAFPERYSLPLMKLLGTELPEPDPKIPGSTYWETGRLYDMMPKNLDFPDIELDDKMQHKLIDLDIREAMVLQRKYEKDMKRLRKQQEASSEPEPPEEPERIKRPEIDYEALADSRAGFMVLFRVEEDFFAQVKNKTGLELKNGTVLVAGSGSVSFRQTYDKYRRDPDRLFRYLKYDIIPETLKHRDFDYGSMIFGVDARLAELKASYSDNADLSEKCRRLTEENQYLGGLVTDLREQLRGASVTSDKERAMQKELKEKESELERLRRGLEAEKSIAAEKKAAYERSAHEAEFYKAYALMAANFPTDAKSVCDWARENFGGELAISNSAETDLGKFDESKLNIPQLCDALYFIDGYTKMLRGEISKNDLKMRNWRFNWEITPPGDIAQGMYKHEYKFIYKGRTYKMDMHLRRGNKSKNLIRVYFTYDEKLGLSIIGSMPGHLSTSAT